jgi:hypothetical protein
MTDSERRFVVEALGSCCQRAGQLHAYIEHRFCTGCGDQGHEDSSKIATKAVIDIRRALGYGYPSSGVYRM